MKKLIVLGIVAILLAGLTGIVMAKCVTYINVGDQIKVTIQGEGIEEDINPETVKCEGVSVVKYTLTGNGDKLTLWFPIEDPEGVLTLKGKFYDGKHFKLDCNPA